MIKYYVSFFIVCGIVAFVFFGAGLMIGASIADESSNINLAGQLVRRVSSNATASYATVMSTIRPPISQPDINVITLMPVDGGVSSTALRAQDACTIIKTIVFNSLVDYLKSRNLNSSLESRIAIAGLNDISDYKGTAQDNSKLLRALLNKEFTARGCVIQ